MQDPGTTPAELPDRIGPYKVLDVLGEGGMGTVYLAEQSEPVRRRIALKVIKLGMDSKRVLARFEAERQALAMMEHDAIARVYDAGATGHGQPYVAMELVKGVPITRYCDQHKLDLQGRLELFLQVCAAIQHAHHKGVIHRDLTPGNILVTVQDGQPTPKIIDFGLARATSQRLTDKTLVTEVGAVLGTPEYMSPEQAGFDALDVDTRTDVYSLGVILYELLVGELPFSSAELRKAGPLEAQRVIRDVDPPTPSTRLTSLGDEQSGERARLRKTDVASLRRRLKGDLDWIVMKALEKDRTRRYGTPESLGNDVRRYLDGEPVLARPPSVGYRVGKFVRRYKVRVTLAAALVVSLVAGIVGSALFALEADAQRARADAQTAAVRGEKDAADRANRELAANLRSTRALGLAKAAMDELRAEPTRAMLLALEAVGIERTLETVSALHRALATSAERRIYAGPAARIGAVDVSPDGTLVLAGTAGGHVWVWDRSTGAVRWERDLGGGADEFDDDVMFVGFFGIEGDRVVAGNGFGDVVLFDLSGNELHRYASAPRRLFTAGCVADDRERLALGYDGRAEIVLLGGVDRDRLERFVDGLDLAGTASALRFGGPFLAAGEGWTGFDSGQNSGRGRLWHVETGIAEDWGYLLDAPRNIRSLDFSSDGRYLLVGANGGNAPLIDLQTQPLERRTVSGNGQGAWTAFLSREALGPERFLSVAGGAQWFRVFDLDGEQLAGPISLEAGGSHVSASVAPGGDLFAVGGDDGRVRVFDANANPVAVLAGHHSDVYGTRFVDGKNRLLSWSADGTVREWALGESELAWRPGGAPAQGVRHFQSRGGGVLVASGHFRTWSESGATRSVTHVRDGDLTYSSLAHAIDEDRGILAVSNASLLSVHDLTSSDPIRTFAVGAHAAYCVIPSSGELVYFAYDSGQGRVLDATRDDAIENARSGPAVEDVVAFVAPSPDGERLCLVDSGQVAHLFRRAAGSWSLERRLEVDLPKVAAFAPDGRTVLVGTETGALVAFDAADGRPTGRAFLGHGQAVKAIAFARDGRLVGTASADGTARIWSPDGSPVAVLEGPAGVVYDVSFTPDGRQLWTAHRDGSIRKWFVDVDDLIAAAKARVSRELTDDERVRFASLLEAPAIDSQDAR